MLAGVVFVADTILTLTVADPSEDRWLDIFIVVGILLAVVGLVGFHELQRETYGRIGRVGFYTVVAASLVQVAGLVGFLLGSMAFEWLILVGGLGSLVGFVLYGAATLRAGVLPRWCGVALIVALPAAIPLGEYAGLLFGVIWLALGYVLWSRMGSSAGQPSRVS
ncbi:MAG: hypothetical protein M3Q60_11375 [Actinomycetota bacterium]|nr:hypothetical protein [Actinomycetota bacterium]